MTAVCADDIAAEQSIEVIDSTRGLESLGGQWTNLGSQRFGPVVSHDWFACAARVFSDSHGGPGSRLHVVALWRGGRLGAVAPLVRIRARGIERLEFLGDRQLFEPGQLLAADESALAALCQALVRQRMPLVLQRLEADDPALALMRAAASERGMLRIAERSASHCLARGTSWSRVSGSQANYRRKLRKLQALGTVNFAVEAPSAAQLAPLLEEAIGVESLGWKARVGGSLNANPRLGAFFRDLCARLAARDQLRIAALRVDGAAVAVQICAEQDGRLWVLKMGYDERFAECSPGLVLTNDLIRHTLAERGAGFEFLGVAEDWQRPWNPHTRQHCALMFYPRTPGGAAAFTIDAVVARARRRARG
jgi:CelD/BcsL family acetyltransferase involved in cellulose biosynthesis